MIEIIQGDALEELPKLPAGSVQCCVTSPPYWGLRKYSGEQERIWNAERGTRNSECKHTWGPECPGDPRGGSGPNAKEAYTDGGTSETYGRQQPRGAFCRRCGAWRGALGMEPTPELYVEHIVEVFRAVRRVLREDGTLWLNMGDCYNAGRKGGWPGGKNQWKDDRYPPQSGVDAPGLKPKDRLGMPWRVAFALQADGWWLRSAIVWAKGLSFCEGHSGSVMPESCRDRPTSSYEMVFLLAKSGAPTYWTHRDGLGARKQPRPDYRWVNALTKEELLEEPPDNAVIECPDCDGKGRERSESLWFGEMHVKYGPEACETCEGEGKVWKWKRVNLWRGHDYFYDWFAGREGASYGDHPRNKHARYQAPGQPEHTSLHKGGPGPEAAGSRNWRNVWVINPQAYAKAHFATYPEKLVEKCILAGTSPRACAACGAPYERIVATEDTESTEVDEQRRRCGGDKNGEYHGTARKDYKAGLAEDPSEVKARILAGMVERQTTGFQPTCGCGDRDAERGTENAERRTRNGEGDMPQASSLTPQARCTVLDPFLGSGTTLLVAKIQGRDGIGIELSEEYCKLAQERCGQVVTQPLFQ